MIIRKSLCISVLFLSIVFQAFSNETTKDISVFLLGNTAMKSIFYTSLENQVKAHQSILFNGNEIATSGKTISFATDGPTVLIDGKLYKGNQSQILLLRTKLMDEVVLPKESRSQLATLWETQDCYVFKDEKEIEQNLPSLIQKQLTEFFLEFPKKSNLRFMVWK